MTAPHVTIAVITYNGKAVLPECLASLTRQSYAPHHIMIVNNASTDGTPEWIKDHYPDIEVLDYPVNNGPNPARNMGINHSSTDLVLLIDDDAVLHEDCLAELVAAHHRFPDAAVWSPRIVYHDRQDLIQFEGVTMHYLQEAILLSGDTPIEDGVQDVTPIQVAGGVSYLLSREKALAVGLFDEDYFFGRTDGEFTYRLTISGYELYTVPKAVCFHRVKKRGTTKVYYQVRNRWHVILTSYAWRTIFLACPAFLLYELTLFPFLAIKGSTRDYARAVFHVLRDLPAILKKRRSVQKNKTLPDPVTLHCGPLNIRSDLLNSRIARFSKTFLDKSFCAYWKLISPLL